MQLSIDDMLARCRDPAKQEALRWQWQILRNITSSFGLPLSTYEAGPSIVEYESIHGGGSNMAAAAK